jgi:hypothetical protein
MTKEEALAFDLALEALESCSGVPHWPAIRATITAIKQARSAPVQEPDELKHIGEQDSLLDVDERAWYLLVENRGGCRCHISPPCGACSNPISEEEMNEVGYTYTTPPAAQRPFVGLTDEERTEIRREHYARTLPLMDAVEAKLKEKNT